MASQKFERGSEHAQMMIDFVKLIQDFYGVENTQEYTEEYMKRMYGYAEKYKNIDYELAQHLGLGFLDYIEEKQRK